MNERLDDDGQYFIQRFYFEPLTQWCQEGKTAIWIHKQLIQQGFKGAPSSTRRKVQEIKATLSIKKE